MFSIANEPEALVRIALYVLCRKRTSPQQPLPVFVVVVGGVHYVRGERAL